MTRASVNDGVLYIPRVSKCVCIDIPTAAASPEGRYCECRTCKDLSNVITPKITANTMVGSITCGGSPSLFSNLAQSTQTYIRLRRMTKVPVPGESGITVQESRRPSCITYRSPH